MNLEIDDLKRIVVKPGDKFVLRINEVLSREACDRATDHFSKLLGAPVILLERGQELSIVGSE